jgi:hypothetical protein
LSLAPLCDFDNHYHHDGYNLIVRHVFDLDKFAMKKFLPFFKTFAGGNFPQLDQTYFFLFPLVHTQKKNHPAQGGEWS